MTEPTTEELVERLRDQRHLMQGDGLVALLATTEQAAQRLSDLEGKLGEAEKEISRRDQVAREAWGDQEDEHAPAIEAAHPVNSHDHDTFHTALKMVGKRHGKYELVGLVNWLLRRAEAAESKLGEARRALEGDQPALREQIATTLHRSFYEGDFSELHTTTELTANIDALAGRLLGLASEALKLTASGGGEDTVSQGAVRSKGPTALDPEGQSYLDGVVGVVEANRFEQSTLWDENRRSVERINRQPKMWKENHYGIGRTIGHVGDMPVFVSLMSAEVDGQKLLFIDPTSQVVDHRMVRAWLDANMPASAFWPDGRLNITDATNFHDVFRAPFPAENSLSGRQGSGANTSEGHAPRDTLNTDLPHESKSPDHG